MGVAEQDVDRLLQHIESQLPSTWTAWPGGWPNEVEVALIDAVLSIRSRTAVRLRGSVGASASTATTVGRTSSTTCGRWQPWSPRTWLACSRPDSGRAER